MNSNNRKFLWLWNLFNINVFVDAYKFFKKEGGGRATWLIIFLAAIWGMSLAYLFALLLGNFLFFSYLLLFS